MRGDMFDKLEDLLIRFEEILSELHEPTVTANQERFRKLMKEQSDLTPIVDAYTEYKKCRQEIEDSLDFDYVFIVLLQMGIKGAAIGTGIGYMIPSIIGTIFFLMKRSELHFCKPNMDVSVLLIPRPGYG